MNVVHKGLTLLLRSALTGEKLPMPDGFTPEAAREIIKRQGLAPLVYAGARNCGIPREDPFLQKLWQRYLRHTLQSERQMAAVNQVLHLFAENGIDCLPLKGCVMKSLYPSGELRVMGDADILIRQEQYDRIRPLVEEMGFRQVRESLYDYEWQREDLYLEPHKSLISPAEKDLYALLGTGWEKAVCEEGNRYVLSPEDTFLFLFAHMTKHYRNCGIGSRHMVDLYVYRRANPGMDENYLETAMEKLGLLEFYRNILRLLDCWFSDGPEDSVVTFITEYVFSGGSFGLQEYGVHTEAARKSGGADRVRGSRRKTLLRTVFPDRRTMAKHYRILEKLPALLPILWVYRWFEVLLRRPERIGRKLRVAAQTTDEKVIARQKALQYVGLDILPEEEPGKI